MFRFSVETFYKISLALGVGMDELARETEEKQTGNSQNAVPGLLRCWRADSPRCVELRLAG